MKTNTARAVFLEDFQNENLVSFEDFADTFQDDEDVFEDFEEVFYERASERVVLYEKNPHEGQAIDLRKPARYFEELNPETKQALNEEAAEEEEGIKYYINLPEESQRSTDIFAERGRAIEINVTQKTADACKWFADANILHIWQDEHFTEDGDFLKWLYENGIKVKGSHHEGEIRLNWDYTGEKINKTSKKGIELLLSSVKDSIVVVEGDKMIMLDNDRIFLIETEATHPAGLYELFGGQVEKAENDKFSVAQNKTVPNIKSVMPKYNIPYFIKSKAINLQELTKQVQYFVNVCKNANDYPKRLVELKEGIFVQGKYLLTLLKIMIHNGAKEVYFSFSYGDLRGIEIESDNNIYALIMPNTFTEEALFCKLNIKTHLNVKRAAQAQEIVKKWKDKKEAAKELKKIDSIINPSFL